MRRAFGRRNRSGGGSPPPDQGVERGNQGSVARDGVLEGWDLHPGGWAGADDTAEEVLLTYFYQNQAEAFCFAYAGLRPTDSRAIIGPADMWLQLPERDYWH
ncbi:hypothetical protein [Spirillospora sp. NPDC048824]|uniref:hypothetical protein n=1 Tax=Spirillospora sp. NPDC048824 TaxID=3364526 RepID=UPI00372053AC